jgi:SAM-dependent methyltransferase
MHNNSILHFEFPENLKKAKDGIWYAKNHIDLGFLKYDDTNWSLIEQKSFWYRHRAKIFIEAINRYPPSGPIFEIGAGRGSVTAALQKNNILTVPLEPTVYLAKLARERGCENVICATIEDSGFSEQSMANIGLFDVLEHIQEDLKYLNQLRVLIKNDGRLYCAVPAYNFLWSNEDSAAGHFRRYMTQSLADKMKRSGFLIEYQTYYFRPLVLPILLARSIPSMMGFRDQRSPLRSEMEHLISFEIVAKILEKKLSSELRILQSGESMKFGASCFIVARAK